MKVNLNNKLILCQFSGGSHLYGLNNQNSDVDERGVFMNTDVDTVLGLKRFDEARFQPVDGEDDVVYKELVHFMRLVQRSNSEAMELLFANDSVFGDTLHPYFAELRQHAFEFVTSESLFNCLRGYMKGERRLALGERSGKLGGKRYESVTKLGFSPKNFTQLFRLAEVGVRFFRDDYYMVNVKDTDKTLHEFLMSVKSTPEKHTKEELDKLVDYYENELVKAYESRKKTYNYNDKLANNLVSKFYLEVLLNKK